MRSKAFLPKIMMCKLNRIGSLAPGSAKLSPELTYFYRNGGGVGSVCQCTEAKARCQMACLVPWRQGLSLNLELCW